MRSRPCAAARALLSLSILITTLPPAAARSVAEAVASSEGKSGDVRPAPTPSQASWVRSDPALFDAGLPKAGAAPAAPAVQAPAVRGVAVGSAAVSRSRLREGQKVAERLGDARAVELWGYAAALRERFPSPRDDEPGRQVKEASAALDSVLRARSYLGLAAGLPAEEYDRLALRADQVRSLPLPAGAKAGARGWLDEHLKKAQFSEASRKRARAALPELALSLGLPRVIEAEDADRAALRAAALAKRLLEQAAAPALGAGADGGKGGFSAAALGVDNGPGAAVPAHLYSGPGAVRAILPDPSPAPSPAGARAIHLDRIEAARQALEAAERGGSSPETVRMLREQLYLLSKLGQRSALENPAADAAEAEALDGLLGVYKDMLGGPATEDPGLSDSLKLDSASLEVLKKKLQESLGRGSLLPAAPVQTPPPLQGTPKEQEILERVARIEAVKAEVQARAAERESAANLLALADRMRGTALRQRREGRDMLEFRKNFARLSMVMDLSYSLNVILAAEKAVAGMQALLQSKLEGIDAQRERSRRALEEARRTGSKAGDWEKETERTRGSDGEQSGIFSKLAEQTGALAMRIGAFGTDVKALLDAIDARDRGRSANALDEYRRRLALLPTLREYREHGYPDGGDQVTKLSVDKLKAESQKVDGYLRDLVSGESKLESVPKEFAGVLVIAVPGIPAYSASNPDAAQALAILGQRRTFWSSQKSDFQKMLSSVDSALDGSNTRRESDDFGDSVPQSLAVYRDEKRSSAEKARAEASVLCAAIDESASRIGAAGGGSLPTLAGRGLSELRSVLPGYADSMDSLNLPDNDAGLDAKVEKIAIARQLPFLGDALIRWAEGEEAVKIIESAIRGPLPEARRALSAAVDAVEAVLQDVSADEAFVNAGFPPEGAEALIARKRSLLSSTLKPMLGGLKNLLDNTLIPFQRDQAASMDAGSSREGLATLYKEKANLYERVRGAYKETMPWSLASMGAKPGDSAGARANIEAWRKRFGEYRQLVADFQDEIKRRKDPDNTETEEVYGQKLPFSLPKRVAQLSAENIERAAQINSIGAEVNSILEKLDAQTGGRHSLLSRFRLLTGVKGMDQASAAQIQAFADSGRIEALAAELKSIGDAASAGGGDISVGGGSGGIPTGEQPPVRPSDGQMTGLLALDAIKRLVPTSMSAGSGSYTEALARYLFTKRMATASQEGLDQQVPFFEKFLAKAASILDLAFADLDADVAYVSSPGSESGEAVMARKSRVYAKLRELAVEGAAVYKQKVEWSKGSSENIDAMKTYYGGLETIYSKSGEALDAEYKAAQTYMASLQKTADDLAKQRETVAGWLKQLNDPHESALNRIAQNLSTLQDKTRAVLESNVEYHRSRGKFDGSDEALRATLSTLEKEQAVLRESLKGVRLEDLNPSVAARVADLGLEKPGWLAAGAKAPQALILKKSGFAAFLGEMFSSFDPASSSRDIVRLREELLKNPMALAQLLPNSKMLEVGDDPNGFYLVYSTEFSTPGGLETTSQVSLGNVARLWDNNVSLIGHRFASPPSPGNAPFGDQGITVQVESLQGKNWVNYLDVTFHRQIQDIPRDMTPVSQAQESRMMVFDDFALMLAGDRLYFGATGFGDMALSDIGASDPKKPYYYGGNLKASVKFNQIMKLNAEQTLLFAKDPRSFLQKVNLDFTQYDPSLNQDFIIDARGEKKELRREKVGVQVDLQKALETADNFTVDFFLSQLNGTDDISQRSLGATVVKGFEFQVGGVPVNTQVSGTGELGEKYNTGTARVSFELPNQGVVLAGSGKIIGDAESYLIELRKKLGPNTGAFVSWGSPYIGLNNRLTIGADTVFTLGELWRSVVGNTAQALLGGEALKPFNENLDAFFKRDTPDSPLLAELQRVFESDTGKKMLSLEIGRLSRDIGELRKAGAFLDNTRLRGMVGFVTNPVGTDTADRAVGGGFQVGTNTELSLSKTQKALIESKTASLFSSGLSLQTRLLDLAKLWELTVVEMLEARWRRDLALYIAQKAQDETMAKEGVTIALEAAAAYRQAGLRYNQLTGRPPDSVPPFAEANPQDMDYLMTAIGKLLSRPERLSEILRRMDPEVLDRADPGFNVLDWIPWIERFTFSFGVQFHDILANQVIGAGISVRLPIYDPNSSLQDKALRFEARATLSDMLAAYSGYRLKAEQEYQQTLAYDAQIDLLKKEAPRAADALADAMRGYRNNLVPAAELRESFRRWYWAVSSLLEARARASLKTAWTIMDLKEAGAGPVRSEPGYGRPRVGGRIDDLDSALNAVEMNSDSLESVALRSEAAQELIDAASRRIEKVSVDLNIGVNLTAAGVAWIPAFGITGLGLFPIVSVRIKPEELKELETSRRGGESAMYAGLSRNLQSQLAMQFFTAYNGYRSAKEALAIYEGEILPELRKAAQAGGAAALRELAEAEAQFAGLKGEQGQTLSLLNHLLGRPGDHLIMDELAMEGALEQLKARFAQDSPLDSRLSVLKSRVETARAVEAIVDKNLKLQELRAEPVSLIGRSLGRLIDALSGNGDPSPELMAMARHQTLESESELRAFERSLPALRARIRFELARTARGLEELEGRMDGRSRLAAAALRRRQFDLKAQAEFYGAQETDAGRGSSASVPASYDELESRLAAAFQEETPISGLGAAGTPEGEGTQPIAKGFLRYYDLRTSLGKDPIGRAFTEGWVEVRLNSRTTPPEALLALAALQQEKADQIQKVTLSRARAESGMLAARLRMNANLLLWARKNSKDADFLDELETEVRKDLSEAAAHLGVADFSLQKLLAIVPADETADPEAAAAEYSAGIGRQGVEAMRELLFERGLPEEWAKAADALVQLKANVIAEKMSYKGFTPVGAFGIFRGNWTGGVFLEAPDPERVRRSLEGILDEALFRELESQDRTRGLSLRLHSLMASVADKTKLLAAQQERLGSSRQILQGLSIQLQNGMGSAKALLAARRESADAWKDMVLAMTSLRMDFIQLVTELKALGYPARSFEAKVPAPAPERSPLFARNERGELLRYLAERMADAEFAGRLDRLFDGTGLLADDQRVELSRLAGLYRGLRSDADAVRHHEGFSPQQRLELLKKADVEGRRRQLEAALGSILDSVEAKENAGNPARRALFALLMGDVQRESQRAASAADSDDYLLERMRDGYWRSAGRSQRADAAYRGLSRLQERVDDFRMILMESYLDGKDGPESFILKDAALDAYLKALIAFDEGVLKVYASDTFRKDPNAARSLNDLFSLSTSVERRRALLRYGRGMLAAEALIDVERARLGSLRLKRAAPMEIDLSSQRLAYLKDLRERWVKDPRTLSTVYAVIDGEGGDTDWITREEFSGYEKAYRLVRSSDDRRWLLPAAAAREGKRVWSIEELRKAEAREVLGGRDAETEDLEAARRRLAEAEASRAAAEFLKRSPFLLMGSDGMPLRGMDLPELRRIEAEGRVLYFSAQPDASGLHRAVHPLTAQTMTPKDLVMLLRPNGDVPAGRFGSLEALERSADKGFYRIKTGVQGLRALAAEAELKARLSERLGWINMKLEAYAFALDKDGRIAAVYMDEKELKSAGEKPSEEAGRGGWTLHKASDLELGLTANGLLASVRLGSFKRNFTGVAERWVSGELWALELDGEGRLAKVFTSRRELEKAAATWWIEDVEGRVWTQEKLRISPTMRLKRYIDPETRLPVLLGRALLQDRLEEAADELAANKRWAYMPGNWANIILETPRGIVKTPIELITGRDPNQEGYIGRVYMRRSDGGATVRRGPMGKLVHFLDIFEILPDPVRRFHDPSQYPDQVTNDSPLLPGELEHEKNPVTDTENIHFGAGALLRSIRYAKEDLEDARGRILGAFNGGVREAFLETVRGRDGNYVDSRIRNQSGSAALEAAIAELGALAGADGDALLDVDPEHIEVERVRGEVQLRLGSEQYAGRAQALREQAERLASEPEADIAELRREVARIEERLERTVVPPVISAVTRAFFPYAGLVPARLPL